MKNKKSTEQAEKNRASFDFLLVFSSFLVAGIFFLISHLSHAPWEKWADSYASTSELRYAIEGCLEITNGNDDECNSFDKLNLLNFRVNEKQIQNASVKFFPGSVEFLMTGKDGKDTCEVSVTRSIVEGSPKWERHLVGGHVNQWMGKFPCDDTYTGSLPLRNQKMVDGAIWKWVCPNEKPSDCRVTKAMDHTGR